MLLIRHGTNTRGEKTVNNSKTTKRCTKCFTFKPNSQFELQENGNYKSWCLDCSESYDKIKGKVLSGSSHYSAFKGIRGEEDAKMTKEWLADRIEYLTKQEDTSNCSLTRTTRELNQTIFKKLYC